MQEGALVSNLLYSFTTYHSRPTTRFHPESSTAYFKGVVSSFIPHSVWRLRPFGRFLPQRKVDMCAAVRVVAD